MKREKIFIIFFDKSLQLYPVLDIIVHVLIEHYPMAKR